MSKNSIIDNQVEHKFDYLDEPLIIKRFRKDFAHSLSIENDLKYQLGFPIELLSYPYTKSQK